MLKEVKRLWALGYAIHWVKERSKAPVENAWSKGPRKSIEELKKTYMHGMNIGVRLGRASDLGSGYLAVIDCDVKSVDPRHLDQLEEKLKELFGAQLEDAPRVASGRGNGSRHYHIKTKEPVSSRRLAQASEKVKVLMPSVKASKSDTDRLSTIDIQAGYRMRAAWEISLMGEGSQVVLPPSVHPDSGKQYVWAKPIDELFGPPLVEIGDQVAPERARERLEDWTPIEVVLDLEKISERIKAMIVDGEGVEDRSAALFAAALAMCKAGLDDDQILSVLTDEDYFLGRVARDHTQSGSRKRNAEWVKEYTLKRARYETDGMREFEAMVEIAPLSEAEGEELREELVGERSPYNWKSELECSKNGAVKITLKNTILVLENDTPANTFKRDEFANAEVYGAVPPWGGTPGEELRDLDAVLMRKWFADFHGFEPNRNLIEEAVAYLAHKSRFHPVKIWLESLPAWDGVPRADTWIKRLLKGEAPEPYLSAISRKFLVAMIARVFEPGIKFDTVLTLVGEQGVRKSTTFARLAAPWGSDARIDINDKDGVLAMRGAWLIELGELSSLNKAEVEHVKEFISRSTDRIRVPFGRRTEKFPRQCIFAGTTNNTEFLKDETGNRRFWPVKVGECDIEALEAEREQLFAEAMLLYGFGENLWVSGDEESGATKVQLEYLESDVLEDRLLDALEIPSEGFNPERFTLHELYVTHEGRLGLKDDRQGQLRVGRCLRKIGYEKCVARTGEGRFAKMWRKKDATLKDG